MVGSRARAGDHAMGVEIHFVCLECREHAALGSAKPWTWHGFRAGNRYVAELFTLHAAPGCRVALYLDHSPVQPPWSDDSSGLWREDLRSIEHWWSSIGPLGFEHPVCGACGKLLADRPRVTVGRHLAFCGTPCYEAYRDAPGRTHRPCPVLPSSLCVAVACEDCLAQTHMGLPDRFADDTADAEAFAIWLLEHGGFKRGWIPLVVELEDLPQAP